MGCNVSKDVKVEDQGNTDAAPKDTASGLPISEEKAAEKIQASFRGYKTRKSLKDSGIIHTTKEEGKEDEKTKSVQENVHEPSKQRSQQDKVDETLDIDLTDAELEKAAYKIQASYRNFSKKKQEKEKPSNDFKEEVVENKQNNMEEQKNVANGELDDIDLTDADLEKVACKIQASYRNFTKKKLRKEKPKDEPPAPVAEIEQNHIEEQKNVVNGELDDIDLTDADLEKAAYKIQASYRNFTKKKQEKEKHNEEPSAPVAENEQNHIDEQKNGVNGEIEDIDLEDPDVEKAALKIQSTFRGYKVRKEINPDSLQDGE